MAIGVAEVTVYFYQKELKQQEKISWAEKRKDNIFLSYPLKSSCIFHESLPYQSSRNVQEGMNMNIQRRYPIGAEVQPNGGTHFRVWAPVPKKVEVLLESGPGAPATIPLKQLPDGYFVGLAPQAAAGTRYRFRVDGTGCFPDPASRYQPDGPHGASQVVDSANFDWHDSGWQGVGIEGQVIYEMHIGTFTREGTWQAAQRELAELADCGMTVLEVMPVADFSGRFGWGYDGVGQFAPVRLYGDPDDFRHFVDEAHRLSLGVILDVVYNHFGPDGNYLKEFALDYFTEKDKSEWGERINFDGENAGSVREYFLTNAAYWIEEFHLDGLRLDATQDIVDVSPENIIKAIRKRVREAARGRKTIIVAENEPQINKLVGQSRERWIWAGRPLERRLPSQRYGCIDRAQRSLLHRLPGQAAGVYIDGEVWVSLPGAAV